MADTIDDVQTVQAAPPIQDDTLSPEEQEKFNRLLSKRLEREKATSERERQKAIEEARRAGREEAEMERMTEDEKAKRRHEQELSKLQKERDNQAKELAEARRALALSKAEAKLTAAGLPAELASNVLGDDDDATDANIASMSKIVNDLVTKKVGESLSHGAPRAGGSEPSSAMGDVLDKAMGIKR